MAPLPVDTSMTGYTSGSVDRQDDIYRNRRRPQSSPLAQTDSGYGSAVKIDHNSPQVLSCPSLLSLANSVKCSELLNNDSNFALHMAVECYESGGSSMSTPSLSSLGLEPADLKIERQCLDEKGFIEYLSVCHSPVLFVTSITEPTMSATSSRW